MSSQLDPYISTTTSISSVVVSTGVSNTNTNSNSNNAAVAEWPTDASSYQFLGKIGQGAFATVWKALKITAPITTTTTAAAATTTSNATIIDSTITSATGNNNDPNQSSQRPVAVSRGTSLAAATTGGSPDCAVKVLDLDHVDTNLSEIRLEVQAMRLLSHENILQCLTAFVVDRHLWLITPLMRKGSSLHCLQTARRALRIQQQQGHGSTGQQQPPMSMEPHIMYILHETLLGLQYIHENGQIHRDIKAGNILLDDTGDVKIADFGVSGWLVQGGSRQEKAKTFVGTPCWMAPEVMEQVNGYDYKADIWSLGITALELARGYAPYAKYPPMKVLILTIQEDPPSLQSYDTEVEDIDDSPDTSSIRIAAQEAYSKNIFEPFVTSCLQKNPSKRPNCSELLANTKLFGNNNQYTAPESRSVHRQAIINQVCSLVPDVGSSTTSNNPRMPGNTPVSIILSQAAVDDNRPAGTTWVFADGSSSNSQIFSSSTVTSPSSHHQDDILAALDEFERQTGGENYISNTSHNKNSNVQYDDNYNEETIRAGNQNHPTYQQQQPQSQNQSNNIPPPIIMSNSNSNNNNVDDDDDDSHDDDIDEFMNEFEQTTAGEDYRKLSPAPDNTR